MRLLNYLNESAEGDNAKAIADIIDDFTEGTGCDINNYKVCHAAVYKVKQQGKDLQLGRFSFYSMLTFYIWDESKWSKMMDYIKTDKSWQKIKVRPFIELVEDIGDGTVNGHSFIAYGKKPFTKKQWYIDPYLSSAGVVFKDIQKTGKWFDKAFKSVGIRTQ